MEEMKLEQLENSLLERLAEESYAKAGDYWGALKISKMTGKLIVIPGQTSDCLLNPGCEEICKWLKTLPEAEAEKYICYHCYAMRYLSFRDKVAACYARNSEILAKPMAEEELPLYEPGAYVRFESFGDLMNLDHLDNLCRIARKNPGRKFLLMTKRHEIVYAYIQDGGVIPANLILSGSSYRIGEPGSVGLPEERDKAIQGRTLGGSGCGLSIQEAFNWLIDHGVYRHTFTVWDEEQITTGLAPRINCGENHCKDCLACWSSVYSDRHEKLK